MKFTYIMPNLGTREMQLDYCMKSIRGSLFDRELLANKINEELKMNGMIKIAEMNGAYNKQNLRTIKYNEIRLNTSFYNTDLKNVTIDYCLHTEPSLGQTITGTDNYDNVYYLVKEERNKRTIKPLLKWNDPKWVRGFANEILYIMKKIGKPPKIIEVHPPNRFICNDMCEFTKGLELFRECLGENIPEKILVENRASDLFFAYDDFPSIKNARFFLVSYLEDILKFVDALMQNNVSSSIGVVADIGQLVTMESMKNNRNGVKESITDSVFKIVDLLPREHIYGFHLYGIGKYKRLKPSHQYPIGGSNDIDLVDWKIFFDKCRKKYEHLEEFYLLPEVGNIKNTLKSIKMLEDICNTR